MSKFEFTLTDKNLPEGFQAALEGAAIINREPSGDEFADFILISATLENASGEVVSAHLYKHLTLDGVYMQMAQICKQASKDPEDGRMLFDISVDNKRIAELEETVGEG